MRFFYSIVIFKQYYILFLYQWKIHIQNSKLLTLIISMIGEEKLLKLAPNISSIPFINLVPARQFLIITNRKKYGRDRKNTFTKLMDGLKKTVKDL